MKRLAYLLCSFFWSAALHAFPAEPVHLTERLSALCDALNAHILSASSLFFAEVDGLSLEAYSSGRGVLPLRGALLTGLGGALAIDAGPIALESRVSPEGAKTLGALSSQKKLSARAAFRIDADAETPCAVSTLPDGRTRYTIAAELVAIDLLKRSNGRPLLRYRTATAPASNPGKEPLEVLIAEPVVSAGDLAPESLKDAAGRLAPALKRCYASAVEANTNAQGTLTLRFSVNEHGNAEGVSVVIDTLGDADANRCVTSALTHGTYPVPAQGEAEVSMTVYFLQQR